MVPAVAAALALLVRGASHEQARRLAWVVAVFAVIGIVVVLNLKRVLGTAYEPFASDVFTHLGAGKGEFDVALAYPLSVMNQAMLFFRYLVTWLVPWPGWMSIDVRVAFPQELLGWHTAGFVAWLAYPVGAGWLLWKGGRRGLVGFALLSPWLYALTEMVTVRVQEPYVLYRSYLWMSCLPAIVALADRLAARPRLGLAAAACVVLAVATHDRLDTFSSPVKLWTDAIDKNADPRAPYVERAYVQRGFANFDAGRMEAAVADIERALELNASSPDAHLARGSLRFLAGQLGEALADLDRAVALDPSYASAYDKRCAVKMGLGRAADALGDCENAVKLDPKNHDAWINSGVLNHQLKRRAQAAESYRRALQLEPESGPANYNYGMLLIEDGRRDEEVRRHIVLGCKGGIQNACEILRNSRQAR